MRVQIFRLYAWKFRSELMGGNTLSSASQGFIISSDISCRGRRCLLELARSAKVFVCGPEDTIMETLPPEARLPDDLSRLLDGCKEIPASLVIRQYAKLSSLNDSVTCLLKAHDIVWIEIVDGQKLKVDGKIVHNSVGMHVGANRDA